LRNNTKVKKIQTSEHIVWETDNGRLSIENMAIGRIVRSNVRSMENAEEYIGEMEGTLVACDQVGYHENNGHNLRSSKRPDCKDRQIGEIENGWTYLGGSVEGPLDKQYSIWLSPKGRYSLEKCQPEKSLIAGLKKKELHEILKNLEGTPGGNIAYQLSFPGF